MQKHNAKPATIGGGSKIGHSIDGACDAAGVGRTSIYEAIRSGALKARKLGRRTVILDEDLRAWLSALPLVDAA